MNRAALARGLGRHWPSAGLAFLAAWYLLATLPYLDRFPVVEWAQMRIIEPAYKLATQGTYGNDLLAGFYGSEQRYYEFMPLYPLQIALAFKLLGAGIWQARLVSVLGGLLTVGLTFLLGRRLHSARLGLLAAAALCLLKLAVPVPGEVDRIGIDLNTSGVPLLDLARLVRYDLWVPVWLLGACLCFFWAHRRRSGWGFLAAGALVGLATLTHVYAVFLLPVLAAALLWHAGWVVLRRSPLYLLALGWLAPLVPWGAYILQRPADYVGQMLKHDANYHLLSPWLYVTNLLREPWRYLAWYGGSFRHPVLWPRLGIWVMLAGLVVGAVLLGDRVRRGGRLEERFLLIAWPALAVLLGAFIAYKRYYYVLLPLPFMALALAYGLLGIWRDVLWRPRVIRAGLALALAAAAGEGLLGVLHSWQVARATTPYARLMASVRQTIPSGARLLLAEPYWLPLADHEARSVQLPFLLADPRYFAGAPSLDQVLQQLRPDYVVSEERLLQLYARGSEQVSANADDWRGLDLYLEQHCSTVVGDFVTPDYGEVRVYRCAPVAAEQMP